LNDKEEEKFPNENSICEINERKDIYSIFDVPKESKFFFKINEND
jgi:hypothetical protein